MPKPMTLTEAVASLGGAISDLEEALGVSGVLASHYLDSRNDVSRISFARNEVMDSTDRIRRIIDVLKENL